MSSFKAEVIADSSGEWVTNSLAFATEQEAEDYARDLSARWMLVRERRVVPSEDPVNYRFENGRAVRLEA
jgi:hypothetical protein